MRRGDDSALPAKDQGPVKALARNVVDARRSIGEYYMLIVLLLIVLLFLHGQTVKFLAEGAVLVILAVLAFEGWYVSRRVKRLAAERYPGQSTRGVTAYTVMRNISYRKLRMPKPKVKPGDQI
jgi:Na+-transporting methylmalonyl-CoA/oxaloacetate decarboxylase gamma subunit